MIKSFALITCSALSLFSFAQVETRSISIEPATIQSVPRGISAEEFRGQYRGCTIPATMAPSSCCATVVRTVEKSEDDVLDITDPDLSGLMASPNPTKGYLSVSVPPNLIGLQIQVIDMTGRMVGNPVPINGENVDLTLEGEAGIYLISIRTEKEILTQRIVLDK